MLKAKRVKLCEGSANPDVNNFVNNCENGIQKHELELINNGDGGAYLLKDNNSNPLAIFKPNNEDPSGSNNPKLTFEKPEESGLYPVRSIPSDKCSIREVAAFELDKRSSNFAGVPLTTQVSLLDQRMSENKIGSLQKYEKHNAASWDVAPGYFSIEDVHKIGIFDLRVSNTDRHGGNILAKKNEEGDKYQLIPIDHAYCFPLELGELSIEWLYWDQVRKDFSKEHLRYISGIDIEEDLKVLRKQGIEEKALFVFKVMNLVLQIAAECGWNLYKIARFCKRRGKRPSEIEKLVKQVESSLSRSNLGVDDEPFFHLLCDEIKKCCT